MVCWLTGFLGEKKITLFVEFDDYHGGNTPNMDDFKLPTAYKISEYITIGILNLQL